jgi:cobalamin synthase
MATTEADKQALMGFELNYSLGESTGGIALIVLAILALAKIDPMLLNAIAVIVAGIAVLLEDAPVAGKYASASPYSAARTSAITAPAGGISAGTLAGIGGIVLGILAILGIAAHVLTAVAVIVFGAAVLFDFAARAQAAALRISGESPESARIAYAEASRRNTSGPLIAVALITLGILALAGLTSTILVTVALLVLGGYLFLQYAAVAGSFLGATV